MDKLDFAILELLKKNSRLSTRQISETIPLSAPAVMERMRKLEKKGVIKNYTINIDRKRTGNTLLAFVLVKIDRTGNTSNFKNTLTKYSSVLECHKITGAYDYLLKIVASDLTQLEHFLSKKVRQVRGVGETQTMLTLENLKEEASV